VFAKPGRFSRFLSQAWHQNFALAVTGPRPLPGHHGDAAGGERGGSRYQTGVVVSLATPGSPLPPAEAEKSVTWKKLAEGARGAGAGEGTGAGTADKAGAASGSSDARPAGEGEAPRAPDKVFRKRGCRSIFGLGVM